MNNFNVKLHCPFCDKTFNYLHSSDSKISFIDHLFQLHELQLTTGVD